MIAPSLTLDALATVCATDAHRPELNAPFTLVIGGEPWTVATDGHRLIAVRHSYGAAYVGDMYDRIRQFHATACAATDVVSIAPLRDFFVANAPAPRGSCDECNGQAFEECDNCDGDGEIECECLSCNDLHWVECKACKGRGGWQCARCSNTDERIRVRVGSHDFDARIAAPMFSVLPDGDVRFALHGEGRMMTLAGDDWFAAIMPLARLEGESIVPTLAIPALIAA